MEQTNVNVQVRVQIDPECPFRKSLCIRNRCAFWVEEVVGETIYEYCLIVETMRFLLALRKGFKMEFKGHGDVKPVERQWWLP